MTKQSLTQLIFSTLALKPQPPANPNSYLGKPLAYHVTQHVQVCHQCRSYHTSQQVMLEVVGPRFKIFRRVGRFEYNLPIHLHKHEAEEVIACADCAPFLDLSHLPPPPATPNPTPTDVRARWREEKKQAKAQTIEDML